MFIALRRPCPIERRRSIRCPASENRAILEWLDERGFHRAEARLINLSETGVLVETREQPQAGMPVWLQLVQPLPSGVVRATVVRADGPERVGLTFQDRCPPELHRALTIGGGLGCR